MHTNVKLADIGYLLEYHDLICSEDLLAGLLICLSLDQIFVVQDNC